MALPPEPLKELLFDATLVVHAVVTEIMAVGAKPARAAETRKLSGVGVQTSTQTVRLKVLEVLKGKGVRAGDVLTATKPNENYFLHIDDAGPFFLDNEFAILGRYGPDTHSLEKIEKALAK